LRKQVLRLQGCGRSTGARQRSRLRRQGRPRLRQGVGGDLQKRLKPLIRKTQPYAKRIAHKGIWVEPKLLAEIEYRAKSAEGKVRHPFFKRLRRTCDGLFDRFGQWAEKPLDNPLSIPPDSPSGAGSQAQSSNRA
jgi:hypothetical protein